MTAPVYLPPANLHQVIEGVYRSSYPQEPNYSYLKTLNLKTVITLTESKCPKFDAFLETANISHHVIPMPGTKKGIDAEMMSEVLKLALNTNNYPLLIHCNQGKHRTGCVVGAMRMMEGWDTERIVREYKEVAEPKVRECDVEWLRGLDGGFWRLRD